MEKKFLISFLGTFSTGKTTLVKALREELKKYGTVETIYGGTRLVRRYGVRISENASLFDQAVLTLSTVEKLLSANADFVLIDEHLLLHVAYGEVIGFDSWFLERLKKLSVGVYRCLRGNGYEVLNFFLPIIPPQQSKYRSKDVEFRKEVQRRLLRLVGKSEFGFFRITGGYSKKDKNTAVAVRVSQVLRFVLASKVNLIEKRGG